MTDQLEESADTFFSLADLAALDTDSIQAMTSRVPYAGIYTVIGESVKGAQGEPKDGKPGLLSFRFAAEILEAEVTDKTINPDDLKGRKLNESYTLWPKEMQTMLALLKGRYQKVGLAHTGTGLGLGGVEGQPPGWLDAIVGHKFQIRVRTYIKDGETRAAYDWVGPVLESDETEDDPSAA